MGIFWFGWSWSGALLALALYYVRMFGVTGAYHRYFSHRTYRTSRGFQFLLALLGDDQRAEGRALVGFTSSHAPPQLRPTERRALGPSGRLLVEPRGLDRLAAIRLDRSVQGERPGSLPRASLFGSLSRPGARRLRDRLYLLGGSWALFWGFFVSTTLLWHGTFTINSLTHVFGSSAT